jgi:nucleotidyltransferase substrate binding protein (TIGR01987 family)
MSTRFKQRIENFQKAMELLKNALAIESPSVTERAGIVQFYEMAIELGWKSLKDYLESEGMDPKFPKETIRMGIETRLIAETEEWIKALSDRNVSSHLYDMSVIEAIETKIRHSYFPLLNDLLDTLSSKN